jgi:hypothetical protein
MAVSFPAETRVGLECQSYIRRSERNPQIQRQSGHRRSVSWKTQVYEVLKRDHERLRYQDVSGTALGPTQPHSLISNGYQGLFVWGWSVQGVKLSTHLHLALRSKNAWNYTSTPSIPIHGVVLSLNEKRRDSFTFTLPYLLKAQIREVAEHLSKRDLKASNGWQQNSKKQSEHCFQIRLCRGRRCKWRNCDWLDSCATVCNRRLWT